MPNDSPAVILYDTRGNQIAIKDGYSITVDTRGIPAVGQDDVSGEARILASNPDGYLRISAPTLETSVSSIDGKDFATETTLASIKDTDGVKKITDPLPAGGNEIGAVAQGTKAAAADGWPVVLYDASGNPIAITLDGGIYRLESFAKLRNASGTNINPSTEEKQDDAITQLTTIDAVLDSIKDTDGIKKITDELPAGTQEIGYVGQGTKASGTGAWPIALYDHLGNQLVLADGYTVEAFTRGLPVMSENESGAVAFLQSDLDGYLFNSTRLIGVENKIQIVDPISADAATVIQDGSAYRLQVEATTGEPATTNLVREFLENGGSNSLIVNGSGTPVAFTFSAHATNDYVLSQLRFVMSADSIGLTNTSFGKGSSLSNGILISATVNNGDALTLGNIQRNVGFAQFSSFDLFQAGIDELLIATIAFGGRTLLVGGSGDVITVTIRDNLSSASLGLEYFTASITALEEEN